jgi:hypothetical protein
MPSSSHANFDQARDVLALSTSAALLLLFVVLPFVLAVVVIALVQWRAPAVPAALRTPELLANGEPARGTLVDWRSHATSFIDRRPMVSLRFDATAEDGTAFELVVTQSLARPVIAALEKGMTFELRVSPDRTAGAVIFP